MDFEARDFGERDENERRQSPVDVILGIREELAEFRRNGGRQALLAKLRASREKDLLITMSGPDPFGLDPVIEYLEERGLIRIERRPRRRRRRNAENG
jgi:hypothetical protein